MTLSYSRGRGDAPARAGAAERTTAGLGPVARTMFIPLWARARDARGRRPLLGDRRALEIAREVDFDFSIFRRAYGSAVGCVLRGLLFDAWVRAFLERHPEGTVVELGAGLSTRFERIDNGRAQWIDVDVPDAMALRRRFVTPSPRRALVEASVVEEGWTERVKEIALGPLFFVAEGMLMYLAEDDVRALLARLGDAFGPTELAFDSIGTAVVRHQVLHDSMKHMMDAPFRWGLDDLGALPRWDARVSLVDTATLPEIARRFASRVPAWQLAVGRATELVAPRFASAYRIARIAVCG